jgi:hypothetical protein
LLDPGGLLKRKNAPQGYEQCLSPIVGRGLAMQRMLAARRPKNAPIW